MSLNETSRQLRIALYLLTPSLLSGTTVIVLALLGLLVPAWSVVEANPTLADFFYGQQGIVTVLNGTQESATSIWSSISSLPAAYNVTILLLSLVVGLVVFLVLQIVNRVTGTVSSLWAMHQTHPELQKGAGAEVAVRSAIRIIAVIIWFFYCYVTIAVLWPFCILDVRTSINLFPAMISFEYFVLGFGLFVVVLHVHIILLRLIALRPRIFGMANVSYD